MPVALVLSGGGSRGDFQVGAVRYLYERGLRPDIICGCSVGALNGAKLAETGDSMTAIQSLEAIWMRLEQNADMWTEEAWFTEVTNFDIKEWVMEALGTYFIVPPVGLMMLAYRAHADFQDFASRVQSAQSMFNLRPIRRLLENTANFDPAKVRRSGIKLRIAIVGLESGELRYVTESGEMLERKQDTRVLGPALQLAEPCQRIADEIARLQAEQAVPPEVLTPEPLPRLRAAELVDLEIQEKQRELRDCIAQQHGGTLTVRLQDAVLASASIPVAFPPVRLGRESYTDGGVREILPIEAAIDAGADEVIAIAASSKGVPPATGLDHKPLRSFATANLLDITKRVAQEIMPDETLLNETDPPGGWGASVTVIQPSLTPDIHDVMTVDPGLISIQMAHGYMRADDVMQAKTIALTRHTDAARYRAIADELSETRKTNQIVRARKAAWELECVLHNQMLPATRKGAARARFRPSLLEEVREMKRDLRRLIEERLAAGGALPAGADRWWQDWERHPWPTQGRGPWSERDAAFVRQEVPAQMTTGRRYTVAVTMRNAGTNTWRRGGTNPYRLGSQSPQDNQTWGLGRVEVPADVSFDKETTLRFAITAPARAGRYQFQWRMLQEGVAWFGQSTPATSVLVALPQLRVTVQPHPVPVNVSTQVTVSTVDVDTGERVSGEVLINGAVVGRTNTSFSYTFRVRLGSGPLPRISGDEVLSEPTLTGPEGLVRAAGYPDTSIDFGLFL